VHALDRSATMTGYVKINVKSLDHAMPFNVSIYAEHACMLQAYVQEGGLWCK
jgi:hypothetical protein